MHLNVKHKNCFVVTAQNDETKITDGLLDGFLDNTRVFQLLHWTEANHPRDIKTFSPAYEERGLRLWLTPAQDEDAPQCSTWVYNNTTYFGWRGKTAPGPIAVTLKPDMTDMFEVRGAVAPTERYIEFMDTPASFGWRYQGKDGIWRGVLIPRDTNREFHIQNNGHVTLTIAPREGIGDIPVFLDIRCLTPEEAAQADTWEKDTASFLPEHSWQGLKDDFQHFESQFDFSRLDMDQHENRVKQAVTDLFILSGEGANGMPCLHAGVPWFCTLFGRDSLITAEQVLPVNPTITKNTLAILGAMQGKKHDPANDEQPGKIAHEIRYNSERCFTRDVPFGRYYGGIDQTALYLSLMASYARQTQDFGFVQSQKEEIVLAVEWLEAQLRDKPFVTYRENKAVEGPHGLMEKGWKDGAPVLHADGTRAPHPIALCEVQGGAYRAMIDSAEIFYTVLKDNFTLADRLVLRAKRLKEEFEDAFWVPELGTYAEAIDGNGKQVAVVTSNPGHLLRTGIIDRPERIAGVAATFSDPKLLYSGWGARTRSISDLSYDEGAYQLGSVWPHDTREAIRGLRHVGQNDVADKLDAAQEDMIRVCNGRLPELVLGTPRVGDDLRKYGHSCIPQAWSAAGVITSSLKTDAVSPKTTAASAPCPNP